MREYSILLLDATVRAVGRVARRNRRVACATHGKHIPQEERAEERRGGLLLNLALSPLVPRREREKISGGGVKLRPRAAGVIAASRA